MQNNIIQTVIISLLLISGVCCTRHSRPKEVVFFPKENLKNFIDSFAKIYRCHDCVYEIYIDKTNPHDVNILITRAKHSLTEDENIFQNQQPLVTTYSQGIRFNIYSGIERYFSQTETTDLMKEKGVIYDDERIIWRIIDSMGVLNVRKIDLAYPFLTPSYRNMLYLEPISDFMEPICFESE